MEPSTIHCGGKSYIILSSSSSEIVDEKTTSLWLIRYLELFDYFGVCSFRIVAECDAREDAYKQRKSYGLSSESIGMH